MPKKNPIPRYERGNNGSARVRFTENGRRREVSLGKYGSPESKREYRQILEQIAKHAPKPPITYGELRHDPYKTLGELCLDWQDRNRDAYSKSQYDQFCGAIRVLTGTTFAGEELTFLPAVEFGPLALSTVREAMVRKGWTLEYITGQVRRIRAVIKWAVGLELLPPERYYALQSLPPLKSKSIPRERKRQPIPDADIEAVIPELSPTVAAMVRFQRYTGCRPQEVCRLRIEHIDRASIPWHFRPPEHKTAHHGIDRVISVGPKAIEIVKPYIAGRESGPVFRPVVAVEERAKQDRRRSKGPVRKRLLGPSLAVGEAYDTQAYCRAVQRACQRVNDTRKAAAKGKGYDKVSWTPNQLRHTRLTEIRDIHGLDAAQQAGGHRDIRTTQRYAKVTPGKADRAAMGEG